MIRPSDLRFFVPALLVLIVLLIWLVELLDDGGGGAPFESLPPPLPNTESDFMTTDCVKFDVVNFCPKPPVSLLLLLLLDIPVPTDKSGLCFSCLFTLLILPIDGDTTLRRAGWRMGFDWVETGFSDFVELSMLLLVL